MPLNTINGQSTFLLNASPKQLKFDDITDYAGQSVNPANVVGCLTMTGPTGVFYNNTDFNNPDISPSVSTEFLRNLPLNNNGDVVQGSYAVTYRVRVETTFDAAANATDFFTVAGDNTAFFTAGTVITVPSGANAGTYNVVGSVFSSGETVITVAETSLTNEDGISIEVFTFVTRTFNYEFCYALPVVEIEPTVDCDCSKILSRDLTNYNMVACGVTIVPTSIDRAHTVSAPNGQDGQPVASPLVTSLASATVTPIWTGTWTSTVVTELVYTLPTGLLVELTVGGQDSYQVSCSEGLCCVYQCMANLRETYNRFQSTNPARAAEYFPKLIKMTTAWMLYSIANNCGDFTNKRKYLDEIIEIAKSSDCDCCGEADTFPVQVVPVCGAVSAGNGGTVVVSSCGNGITVSSTTAGSTTTFQVCLDLNVLNQNIANYLTANPLALSGLSDVAITGLASGEFLRWDGTKWVNATATLAGLSDVNVAGITNGQILVFDTGTNKFIPATPPFSKCYTVGSYTTPQSLNATGAYTDLAQTLPLATGNNPLSANGDIVEFKMVFTESASTGNICGFALNGAFIAGFQLGSTGSTRELTLKGTITRVSATQLHVYLERTRFMNTALIATSNNMSIYINTETVANIGSTPLVVSPWKLSNAGSSDCVYANYISIKK